MRYPMNERKLHFVGRFTMLQQASGATKIHISRLSVILNDLEEPTRSEREKLRKALGYYHYQKFFGKPKVEKIQAEGDEVVNGLIKKTPRLRTGAQIVAA
jgi:hypothetical protein